MPVHRSDSVSVSPFDSVVFATAAAAVTHAPEVDRVWPGFWNPPTFALYRRDTAVFLYTVDTPPVEFHLVRHMRLPAVLAGRLFFHQGSWPGLRGGVLPVDSKAVRLAMAVTVERRPVSQLEFLLHENFHGGQFREFQHLFDPDVPRYCQQR